MIQIKKTTMFMLMIAFVATAFPAFAADNASKSATYNEDQFLNAFSGKSRKVILEKLGTPTKKEQSVKPSNAMNVIGPKIAAGDADTQKPVNVEMWYYNDLVHYEPKKKYKTTELTFVNDRCMNIAFFNNK
ncbi:hypothetical protein [Methyloradius palustris]|uniref:Uncharacterized protein n=1 Tax=Methyloradius palustris TaxID=2778876 RepID=A0A8D5G0F3_9PROT|nr:hypothetical protein [Methyloradius palustris]BCM25070.1 hypothetical protein ZMTM_13290 [Methyloradius palustris]